MHDVEGIDRELAPLADKSYFQQSEKVQRADWPRKHELVHQALRNGQGCPVEALPGQPALAPIMRAVEPRRTGVLGRLQAVSIALRLVLTRPCHRPRSWPSRSCGL